VIVNDTTITAVAPAHATAGAVDVVVSTPEGNGTGSGLYTYVAPSTPMVTSISPTSGTASGGTPVTITGTNFTGATAVKFGSANASFTVNNATSITATSPAGSGVVDVTVTVAGITSTTGASDQFTYTPVPIAPVITLNATSQTVNTGQTAAFSAAASGTPTPTVQWQQSTDSGATFASISGATSTTYSFAAAASQNRYQYRAVFTNSVGSATTTAATLMVPSAPTVTANPSNQTVNLGQTATFSAAASGTPMPTVQWQQSTGTGNPFSDIPGATSTTYSFTPTVAQRGVARR
jgi:IPT/TIG domain/Immunoglobulin I-set domain